MERIENYEITLDTAAIIGINEKSTKIVENKKDYIINDNSYAVMEHSCEYFGSSYNGRCLGSKKMLGANYKVPIIVEESNELIFFPISEIEKPGCIWISLKWFDKVVVDNNTTYICLKNGKKIPTTISKYSIENQVLRSSKLHLILSERKKPKNY